MAWGRQRASALLASIALVGPLTACGGDVAVPPATSTTTAPTGTTPPSSTSPTSTRPPAPDRLRVAVSFDEPGIGMRQGDTYSGLDVDIARAIAQRMGVSRLTFVESVPGQRETLLATGQADLVISSYSITRERATKVRFAGPYLTTGQDILVSRRSSISRPEQLRGFTVCSAQGSASTDRMVARYSGLHLVERPTVSACVAELREGKVKAVTSDAAILAGYLGRTDGKNGPGDFRLAGKTFGRERYGIGVSLDNPTLCYQVSEALRDLIRDGQWSTLVRTNLPSKDVLGRETYSPPTVRTCRTPDGVSTTSSTRTTSTRTSASG